MGSLISKFINFNVFTTKLNVFGNKQKKSDKPVEMDYVSFDTLNNEIDNQLLKS